MRIFFFALAGASLFAHCMHAAAETIAESAQDNSYVRCLIKRRVEPPEIPKEDSEFCLREAGVLDPGDDERQSRGKAWRDCLVTRVVELDDGISPVGDIGHAVTSLCAAEWRGYASSMWMNPSAKRKFVNGIEKYAAGEGVQAVLLTRKLVRDRASSSGRPTGNSTEKR